MRTKPQTSRRKMSWAGMSITIAVIILFSCSQQSLAQQWTPTTTNPNNITNTNTGNVGVGTTNPEVGLHVATESTATPRGLMIQQSNSGNNSAFLILRKSRGTIASPAAIVNGDGLGAIYSEAYTGSAYLRTGANIKFVSNGTVATDSIPTDIAFSAGSSGTGTEFMRISSAGNVGIGTTAPNYRLEVTGSTSRNTLALIGDGDSVGYSGLKIGALTTTNIATNRTSAFNLHMRKDSWYGGDGSGPSFIIETTSKTGGFAAPFLITPTNDIILNGGAGASGLSYGKVGIGTTAPGVKLEVVETNSALGASVRVLSGSASAYAGYALGRTGSDGYWGVAGGASQYSNGAVAGDIVLRSETNLILANSVSPTMYLKANGNVGIGTTNPGYRLDLQGGALNSSGGLCIAGDCKTAWSQVGGSQWTTSGTTINYTNGSVGIGTSTPVALLDVRNSDGLFYAGFGYGTNKESFVRAGNSTTGVLHVGDLNTAKTLLQESGGNVGIGTATPNSQYKLDVAGNINSSGTITGNNIVAKYQDVAEWVESSQELRTGTLVVLDHTKPNQVIASSQAYDTRVAGVISERPGIALGEGGDNKVLVATTGRVRLMVDASKGPIQIGDLLVTSEIPGVAMKSEAINVGGVQIHRPGTLVGKALEPLAKGQGKILVLLSLQ